MARGMKIKGWRKSKDDVILGAPTWKNEKSGKKIVVDRVVGGGGAVYLVDKNKNIQTLPKKGTGFRRKDIAVRFAISWMRSHPNG